MANDLLTLSIAKSDEPFDIPTLNYGRLELGKTVEITVTESDGTPYDLTDKDITFIEKFSNTGKGIIIDNGTASESGKFIRDADSDTQGKFKYIFQKNAFQGSGTAQFEFITNNETVDTTNPFNIDVHFMLPIQMNLDNATYVSDLASLQAHFNGVVRNASQQTDKIIADLQEQVQDAVQKGNTNIEQQIADAKTKLQNLVDDTQKQITDLTTQIQNDSKQIKALQESWSSAQEQIRKVTQDQIDKLQSKIDAFETQYTQTLATKANKVDLDATNQNVAKKADQTSLTELETKVNNKADATVLANYETVSDAKYQLEAKADKASLADYETIADTDKKLALKANIADTYTKQEVDSAVAGAGKIKSISINKGNKIEPDETGNVDITTPAEPDLTPYAKSIDVNSELAKKADAQTVNTALDTKANKADIDKVLATKANVADSYTKKEIDDKFANTVAASGNTKSISVNGGTKSSPDQSGNIDIKINEPDLTGYAKTADVNTELSKKANITDINAELAAKANKADLDATNQNVAKKADQTSLTELETKVNNKADATVLANYETVSDAKYQLEAKADKASLADYETIADTDKKLALKANIADTYTKQEVDSAVAGAGKIKSISINKGNKIEPDETGNVDITTPAEPDLTPYAKSIDVNSELAKKADAQTVNTALDTKANKADIDKVLATKANVADSYTKKEIDDKFANTVAASGNTKSISVNGGTKSSPDQSGNIDIKINEPDLTGYAKTADVNTELSKKANITDINAELAAKANTADVDSALTKKGEVKSVTVNGGAAIKPDDSGNVAITTPKPDLTAYAKTADVNAQLAAKADITDVDTKLSTKANSDDVTKSLAGKANTTDVVPKTDFTTLQNQYDALKTNYDDLKSKFDDIVKQLATKATIKYFKSDQADTAKDWSGKTAYGIAIIDDALANSATDTANTSTTNSNTPVTNTGK